MNVTETQPNTEIKNKVDFNLFDIVGIRLENPTDDDIKSIKNQLGVEPKDINNEPDITIRFTSKLYTPNFSFIGLNSAGFTEDNFFLISEESPDKKIQIPFEKIGGRINIICEQGVKSIPLLNDIINFTFLGKNYLPLHSSGLYFNGKGLLIMAWANGGKTSTLISFARHGASYVGDEWIVLSPNDNLMYGLPGTISIKEWQLKQISQLLPKIEFKKRIVFAAVHLIDSIHKYIKKIGFGKSTVAGLLAKALPALKRQLKIEILPEKIFTDKQQKNGTPIDFILLAVSHDDFKILVEKCDWFEIAGRMINSNKFEQLSFLKFYNVFKFAFPEKTNEFLENSGYIQNQLLLKAFNNKNSFKVFHPYPVEIEQLYNQINQTIFESKTI